MQCPHIYQLKFRYLGTDIIQLEAIILFRNFQLHSFIAHTQRVDGVILELQHCYNSDVISGILCCVLVMDSKDLRAVRIPQSFQMLVTAVNLQSG